MFSNNVQVQQYLRTTLMVFFQKDHSPYLGFSHYITCFSAWFTSPSWGPWERLGREPSYIFLSEKWLHEERPNVIIHRVECSHPRSSSQNDSPCCVCSMDACVKPMLMLVETCLRGLTWICDLAFSYADREEQGWFAFLPNEQQAVGESK